MVRRDAGSNRVGKCQYCVNCFCCRDVFQHDAQMRKRPGNEEQRSEKCSFPITSENTSSWFFSMEAGNKFEFLHCRKIFEESKIILNTILGVCREIFRIDFTSDKDVPVSLSGQLGNGFGRCVWTNLEGHQRIEVSC